jgi:surfactin family lipopeptide synthetase A
LEKPPFPGRGRQAGCAAPHLSEPKRALLKKYLAGQLGQAPEHWHAIRPRQPGGDLPPLSLEQEQIWLRAQAAPPGAPPFYNESITLHRHGRLNLPALKRSLSEIVRRHEIWRTTYSAPDGHPVQTVHPPVAVELTAADLRHGPAGQREREALRLATEDATTPFDLTRGPLVRFRLASLSDDEHRLFLTMHQSVTDGLSAFHVFPKELVTLYAAFAAGKPSPLAGLPIQFADFAAWQREWLRGSVPEQQRLYWRQQLSGGLPTLPWPTPRPTPGVQSHRGVIQPFLFPRPLSDTVLAMSQDAGVTLFMSLLAALYTLLHCYTGQDDIIVGTLAPAGRKRPEVQALLGCFLNLVALRVSVSLSLTFSDLLRRIREVVSSALSNDDVPFEFLARDLGFESALDRPSIPQVVLSLGPPPADLGPEWHQSFMDVESGGARWGLYLEMSARPEGIVGRAQYNPDLFARGTIIRALDDLQALLAAAAAEPRRRLVELAATLRNGVASGRRGGGAALAS